MAHIDWPLQAMGRTLLAPAGSADTPPRLWERFRLRLALGGTFTGDIGLYGGYIGVVGDKGAIDRYRYVYIYI